MLYFIFDYSIILKLKYEEIDEKRITKQINNSTKLNSKKGTWKNYDNGYIFEHVANEQNSAEPFHIKIDTLLNNIELYITHL